MLIFLTNSNLEIYLANENKTTYSFLTRLHLSQTYLSRTQTVDYSIDDIHILTHQK